MLNEKTAHAIGAPGIWESDWVETGPMRALSMQAQFKYGSGGHIVTVRVVTTLDAGDTLIPIAMFVFNKRDALYVANATGLVELKPTMIPIDLKNIGAITGFLGDRIRIEAKTEGEGYKDSWLGVHLCAR